MTNKRQGIFIPLEIMQNLELDWENKVLLSEIISLDKLEKGCYASNDVLAKLLQIKRQSIHRRIKFLLENKYIKTKNKYSGGKCVGRIIKPTGKIMEAQATPMTAPADNMEAQAVINDSIRFHSMTAGSNPITTLIKTNKTFNKTVINTDELHRQEQIIFNKFNLK